MHRTLYDKIWRDHLVDETPDGTCLLYVDRHLVHEVDSPQAFGSLRAAGLPVKAPGRTLLVVDHNVPTSDRSKPNPDPASAAQIAYFAENAALFGLEYYDQFDRRQGICHVVGPEQGFTLPGTMIGTGPVVGERSTYSVGSPSGVSSAITSTATARDRSNACSRRSRPWINCSICWRASSRRLASSDSTRSR